MKHTKSLFTQDQDLNCEDLVQNVYNLTELELDTYCTLLIMNDLKIDGTVNEIQIHMGRNEKTMINRALKKLFEQGLVSRQTETVKSSKETGGITTLSTPKRGYFYTYKPLPLDVLVVELKERLDNWYKLAASQLKNIKSQFKSKIDTTQDLKSARISS